MNVPLPVSTVRRRVFGPLGVVATVLGLLMLLLPGLAALGPGRLLVDRVAATPFDTVLLIAGGLAVAALVIGTRSSSSADESDRLDRRLATIPTAPPEAVTTGRNQIAAAAFDADIETAVEDGGEPYQRLQSVLELTATSVYADVNGLAREQAAAAVARGTWTTDPVAAALLSDERGPTFDRGRTVRLLVLPAREREERIRRTIATIERLERA